MAALSPGIIEVACCPRTDSDERNKYGILELGGT